MGLLDRWSKKKQLEQIGATQKQEPTLVSEQSVEPKEKKVINKEIKKVTGIKNSALSKVLYRPLVSEKSAHLEVRGVYTFAVDPEVNKFQIKEAVKQIYGVLPTDVRIINVQGKWVRFGRQTGKRKDWKKAVITLPKGKTISIHEGV